MSGFAATIAILSLNVTAALLNAGQVAGTFPVTGSTTTTPITLISPNHGVPLGRTVHGAVSGVVGAIEANGVWELTPVDGNTFALSSYDGQGNSTPSVGTNAYVSGGTISYALSGYRILLGRRWIATTEAVVSPRIVFAPADSRRAWDFVPFGGQGPAPRQSRGSVEQQSQRLGPLLGTKYVGFEIHITGAANPPAPDFGDFDAVEVLENALFVAMFDNLTQPNFAILASSWPSQSVDAGTQTQRGQKKVLYFTLFRPIQRPPAQFVPVGTSLVFTVEPTLPLVPDDVTTFTVSEP
jgi:hypothetical protein